MKIYSFAMLSLVVVLSACSQHTSRLGSVRYLPSDWLNISPNAWQLRELPEVNRVELENLQLRLNYERQGQYYNFFGKYKPSVQNEIDSTINNLDQAYYDLQYSSRAILVSLTPNMRGLSDTHAEREAGDAVTKNANIRMSTDDLNRAILLDRPSSLSPYPVVDN